MARMCTLPRVHVVPKRECCSCRSFHVPFARRTRGDQREWRTNPSKGREREGASRGLVSVRVTRHARRRVPSSLGRHVVFSDVRFQDVDERKIVVKAVDAYIAAEMGSFAFLKELVSIMRFAYDAGVPLLRLRIEATTMNMEGGFATQILTQQQMEIFTSWMALIFVTISLCSKEGEEGTLVDRSDRQIQGVHTFVKSTLDILEKGYNLERLQLQQTFARVEEKDLLPESSPAMELMRQNSRLILLTASMMDDCKSDLLDTGDTVRSLAMQLLAGFIGAVGGSDYPLQRFAKAACSAYKQSVPVSSICNALDPMEMAQDGDIVPVGLTRDSSSIYLKLSLFGRWLSIVYLALRVDQIADAENWEDAFWQQSSMERDADELVAERRGLAQFVANALNTNDTKSDLDLMEGFEISISNPFLAQDSPAVQFMRQQASLAALAQLMDRERQPEVPSSG